MSTGALGVRGWAIAALGAVLFHAGCAAAVLSTWHSDDEDDAALGAPAIEIGLEMTAPRREETDLPPGPEAEASAASPAVEAQKQVQEKTELPKDTPQEAEDPDRLVSTNPTEKPQEETPKPVQAEATPSAESVASEATAAPSSETIPEGTASVAPVQGTGESDRRAKVAWQRELAAHLNRHKRYPPGVRTNAEVEVSFTIDRTGRLVGASVLKGSGNPAFDAAALEMMKRSDPVPAPPARVADDGLTFTLPVQFRLRGG